MSLERTIIYSLYAPYSIYFRMVIGLRGLQACWAVLLELLGLECWLLVHCLTPCHQDLPLTTKTIIFLDFYNKALCRIHG